MNKKEDKAEKEFVVSARLTAAQVAALGDFDGPERVTRVALLRAGSKGNVKGTEAIPLFGLDWFLADFLALPAQAQCDILREAAINIACRTGKASTKLQGKVLSIEATAAYLEQTGTRSSGPTEDDKALAEQRFAVVKADAHQAAHAIEEESELYGNVEHYQAELVKEIGAKNAALYAGLAWSYDAEAEPLVNLQRLYRTVRLWKPKMV